MPTEPLPRLADPERLAALHETALLDAPATENFDRLTRLITATLRTPVALLSLVDTDRQFFLSAQGLAEPWAAARETPLSHSFCQHVVAADAPLLVADARTHPLVCDNLAIPDLGVVAYAGVPLRTTTGQVLGSLCAIDTVPRRWTDMEMAILHDLATVAQSEIVLRERERHFRYLFAHNPHPMWVQDAGSRAFLEVNEAALAHYGYDRAEFLALHPDDIRAAPASPAGANDAVAHRLKDGRVRAMALSSRPLEWLGRPARMVVAHDVTERLALEAELRYQAGHDTLTALTNRAAFMARLAPLLAARARGDAAVAILFLDLDGFKCINDSLGHAAGDSLLAAVAARLRATVRPDDVVARFGGDEFTILLPRLADAGAAEQIAARLLAAMRAPYHLLDREVVVGGSIGIALGAPGTVSAEELVCRADAALYRAKRAGKGRWERHAPDDTDASLSSLTVS